MKTPYCSLTYSKNPVRSLCWLAVAAALLGVGVPVWAGSPPGQSADYPKLTTLPPGHHALLEEMTQKLGLTYAQELEIEPRLHAEESVTKPLLRYTILSEGQRREMMRRIKIAARRNLLPLLTPQQCPLLERDIQSLTATGRDDFGGGKRHGEGRNAKEAGGHARRPKKTIAPQTPAQLLADEASLSQAIQQYAAFTPEEKGSMLVEVKQAALADPGLPITPAERARMESEVRQLASQARSGTGESQ
ncbi:MAG: hypothetical protein ACRD2G_02475 [Terriglobia bacterium]